MEQSLLENKLEDVTESLDVLEVLDPLPAQPTPSYHPTPWKLANQLLDIVDTVTRGRAGLCQKFFSFAFIGGCAAIVNMAVYTFMLYNVHMSVPFAIHDAIAWLLATELSIIANFIPNDYFTFRYAPGRERSWLARGVRFHVTCVGGAILTYLLHWLLIALHVSPFFAQAGAQIIVLFYNFSFHHFFTYRKVKTVTVA